jgi:hypothetical protein
LVDCVHKNSPAAMMMTPATQVESVRWAATQAPKRSENGSLETSGLSVVVGGVDFTLPVLRVAVAMDVVAILK